MSSINVQISEDHILHQFPNDYMLACRSKIKYIYMIHRTQLKIAHNTILIFSQHRNDWRNRVHIWQQPNHLAQEAKI